MGEPSNPADRDRTAVTQATSKPSKRHEGIFDGYNKLGSYSKAFDEMFDGQGNVRGPYKGIFAELAPSDASELEARADALGRAFIDQGITFSLSGQERPFPLDLVPAGDLRGRVDAARAGHHAAGQGAGDYLDDIYGEQEILRDGVIPRRLVTSCEHFHREAVGHRAAQRGAHPRRRHRPGPRRAGQLPGARGQPALAVRACPT